MLYWGAPRLGVLSFFGAFLSCVLGSRMYVEWKMNLVVQAGQSQAFRTFSHVCKTGGRKIRDSVSRELREQVV